MAPNMSSSSPTWSLCIPHLASRKAKLSLLLDHLLPQVEAVCPQVEVLAMYNNGERGLGPVKQDLLLASAGEYFSFVDDDDWVEPDYVDVILGAMSSEADYISFDHRYYVNGVQYPKPVRTGLELGGWASSQEDSERDFLGRDVTQINPVRMEIAKQADFTAPSEGLEDWSYVKVVRPLLHTQARIDRILYHYRHDVQDSNQRVLAPHTFDERLEVTSPCFRWIEPSS